jgi:hypothetical protein
MDEEIELKDNKIHVLENELANKNQDYVSEIKYCYNFLF